MSKKGFFLAVMIIALNLGALQALGDDIPFDTNVPDTGASPDSSAEAPATPAAPNPTTSAASPKAQMPGPSPSVKQELNGAASDDNLDTPKLAPPSQKEQDAEKVPGDLAGLGKLAPFSDIAVITKRYLPKTHRFEFYPDVGMVINDAFFNDFVFGGRLGFYFTENWGVEVSALKISTSARGVTSELQADDVTTTALLTPTSYYGADLKWDPVYGKVGFLDQRIVPFDLYFSLGGGVTGTSGSSNAPTIHIGAGQLFAISKWSAFRWDISWYGMNATSPVTNTSSFFTNLHATIGVSFFFPGASYR